MNNLKKIALGIAFTSVSSLSIAGSVITDWKYINEAGFANATTGNSVVVDGVRTTLDPNTLDPLAPASAAAPTNGNDWVYNADTGLYYDLGSAGYVAGSSHTGATAGASGKQINQSIFEEVGIPTGTLQDEICWGYGPSCLELASGGGDDTSRVEGTATTLSNGGLSWNQGTDLTHTNKLTGEPSLTSIDFLDGLKLYSNALTGGELPLLRLGFEVLFNETFGVPAQQHFDYAPDDAFIINLNPLLGVISNIGANFVEISQFFDLTGALLDPTAHTEYEVVIRVSGLEVISVPGGNTFGLVTPEGDTSVLTSMFAIRAVGVPEPTTLAIFGLSLLGLAGASRRKKV